MAQSAECVKNECHASEGDDKPVVAPVSLLLLVETRAGAPCRSWATALSTRSSSLSFRCPSPSPSPSASASVASPAAALRKRREVELELEVAGAGAGARERAGAKVGAPRSSSIKWPEERAPEEAAEEESGPPTESTVPVSMSGSSSSLCASTR